MTSEAPPREGMMAMPGNRCALITGVLPFDAGERKRTHLVEVEHTSHRRDLRTRA